MIIYHTKHENDDVDIFGSWDAWGKQINMHKVDKQRWVTL